MEGTLWKWTNYLNGWQPRWFVLDSGVLTYYRNVEDVGSGSKGSVRMGMCEVSVHPSDNTRLDLIVPNEAHFYLKAATYAERQRWLVALGSSKACMTNGLPSPGATTVEPLGSDELRAKQSELRVYRDLLMQQVTGVKTALTGPSPDVTMLTDSTSLLAATCDTFMHTLDECMALAGVSSRSYDALSPTRRSPPSKPVFVADRIRRTASIDRTSFVPGKEIQTHVRTRMPSAGDNTTRKTVLSHLADSFQRAGPDTEGHVFIAQFISACQQYLQLIDSLNVHSLAPVKLFLNDQLKTLVTGVGPLLDKVSNIEQALHSNAAAQISLFWIARSLGCVVCFMRELLMGVEDVQAAATVAYGRVVQPHLTLDNQGLASVCLQSLPSYTDLMKRLAVASGHGDAQDASFHQQLMADMDVLCTCVESLVTLISPLTHHTNVAKVTPNGSEQQT